jgi:hypothetical protein
MLQLATWAILCQSQEQQQTMKVAIGRTKKI